jgi:hypothetical protein
MSQTGLEFWFLVILICLDFVICDLEFVNQTSLQYSNTPVLQFLVHRSDLKLT